MKPIVQSAKGDWIGVMGSSPAYEQARHIHAPMPVNQVKESSSGIHS